MVVEFSHLDPVKSDIGNVSALKTALVSLQRRLNVAEEQRTSSY
jgi:hypothetical protein